MATPLDALLGCGWAFPPQFSPEARGTHMVDGTQDIAQSLTILFGTAPGERVMLPEYGCDLSRFVFRERSLALLQDVRATITLAIRRWEQRIDVLDCEATFDPDQPAAVVVALSYRIRRTGVTGQFVRAIDLGGGIAAASTATSRRP